ncbi:MAG: cell envelope integrity EipB family protein [Phyllobacteriaceae bacterium]|nr:cell envelope integrity EipB family protein [Phyllobacteriaceae bacterium]
MSFVAVPRRFRFAPILALAAVAGFAAPTAAAPITFVGHRAVYEMRLVGGGDRSPIAAATGRLVYELSGSACEGWTSRFRMVTRLDPAEGVSRLTDLRTTSFEDGAGKTFDFVNENWVDRVEMLVSKGRATRAADGRVRVRLERPHEKDVALPTAALFPTAHMRAVVEAAEAGRSLADVDLYDGFDDGEKPYHTTVVIGRELTGPDDTADEPAAVSDLLKGHRRWPVDISFFDPQKSTDGEATPEYQLSFLVYDNGISRKMRFDYGSFVLRGDLSSLDSMPSAACP